MTVHILKDEITEHIDCRQNVLYYTYNQDIIEFKKIDNNEQIKYNPPELKEMRIIKVPITESGYINIASENKDIEIFFDSYSYHITEFKKKIEYYIKKIQEEKVINAIHKSELAKIKKHKILYKIICFLERKIK